MHCVYPGDTTQNFILKLNVTQKFTSDNVTQKLISDMKITLKFTLQLNATQKFTFDKVTQKLTSDMKIILKFTLNQTSTLEVHFEAGNYLEALFQYQNLFEVHNQSETQTR